MQIPDNRVTRNSPFATGAPSANDAAANTQSSSGSGSSSSTSTATITANDFLQLLVTELQNQDPTANTDPNEYVDQLVQVNSLQQQIQMNQTLDGGPTLTGASNGVLQELTQMNQTLDGDVGSSSGTGSDAIHAKTHAAAMSTGNLSAHVGADSNAKEQAAQAVATALIPNQAHAAETGQGKSFKEFAARLRAGAPVK